MRKAFSWLFIVLLPLIATGSVYMLRRDLTARNHEWPTQMQYSPAALPQTANAVLPMGMTQQPPVAGTIPRSGISLQPRTACAFGDAPATALPPPLR